MRLFGSTGEPDGRGDGIWDGGLVLMARAMGGGPGIENSKDNERSARFRLAGGRSSGQTRGEKIVKFPTETTDTLNGSSASGSGHTSSVRLSRGRNRTTGKDPADLPRARGRALFKREWGVNRKASVFVLGFWGLSGSSRSYS
ncbi:hypothetical protein Lal_00001870 [Lupinus albus]|nr:hypothetical protein Lal_00001870 [Lupinus albus]